MRVGLAAGVSTLVLVVFSFFMSTAANIDTVCAGVLVKFNESALNDCSNRRVVVQAERCELHVPTPTAPPTHSLQQQQDLLTCTGLIVDTCKSFTQAYRLWDPLRTMASCSTLRTCANGTRFMVDGNANNANRHGP